MDKDLAQARHVGLKTRDDLATSTLVRIDTERALLADHEGARHGYQQ